MRRDELHDRLTRINALFAEGFTTEAWTLVVDSKRDLLASEERYPELLGWLRYYELRCLYALKAWKDAVDAFRAQEPVPYVMSLKNAAWTHSVAAECAAELGRAEDVVRWMERAFDFRKRDGDAAGMAMALNTACVLLNRLNRADLNTPFADRMIELGLKLGAENAVIEGVSRLLENYTTRSRTTVRRRLEKSRTLLPELRDPEFQAKAEEALKRIREALS